MALGVPESHSSLSLSGDVRKSRCIKSGLEKYSPMFHIAKLKIEGSEKKKTYVIGLRP